MRPALVCNCWMVPPTMTLGRFVRSFRLGWLPTALDLEYISSLFNTLALESPEIRMGS